MLNLVNKKGYFNKFYFQNKTQKDKITYNLPAHNYTN